MSLNLPLDGIRILDLSRMLPGPYCTMILGDLGAEIIRVEDPSYPYANPLPYYPNSSISAFNAILMRNKKSIALNFKKKGSLEVFYKLVENSNVVLESFRPGVAEKLKIDYETLKKINPNLIYCSLTGFGQTGPYKKIPGHDLNYQAISGFLDLNMERDGYNNNNLKRKPIVPGIQSADIGGALYSVIGILATLIEKIKNPNTEGQHIDISMLDCAFSMNPMVAAFHFTNSKKKENMLHGEFPFYSCYRTKDNKFMAVGAIEIKFWHAFCEALEIPDYKGKQFAREEEREKLFSIIEQKIQSKSLKEWLKIFENYDTCVTEVNNFSEACKDPQIIQRGMIEKIEHPKLGSVDNIASPIKLSKKPLKIRAFAPETGENRVEILKEIGYSEEEIKLLRKKGIFR